MTYLLCLIIAVLVLGPQNWSIPHYAGLVGGPLLIYGVRKLITLFFDWRIGRQQLHLDNLQKQREDKIADLKKATKYDSTQELLSKYGGSPPVRQQTPSKQSPQGTKRKIVSPVQRTGLPPPPTANIPGRNATPQQPPHRPNVSPPSSPMMSHQALQQSPSAFSPDAPGFAPNAFTQPPPSAPPAYHQGHQWYDRILDVLLGEDETAAKNRIALICSNCKLVNGQAPPSIKNLEDLGKWRCSGCGTMNGLESPAKKAVKEMVEKAKADDNEEWEKDATGNEEDIKDVDIEDSTQTTTAREAEDGSNVSRRVTRSANKDETLESLE